MQSFARKLIVYHQEHVRNRRGTAKTDEFVFLSDQLPRPKGLLRVCEDDQSCLALTVPLGPRQNTDRTCNV